jgi:hypothetical protein
MLRRTALTTVAAALVAPLAAQAALASDDAARPAAVTAPTLIARSTIPATLYLPGPVSGTALGTTPINGVTPPFPGQPIPGFSAILELSGGRLLGLADNGFGSKANSADYLLQLDVVRPNWKTAAASTGPRNSGNAVVERPIRLSDPRSKAGFPLTRADRQLTGADFDIESIQPGYAGDYWIGEEFGPFVMHVDGKGRLLQAPIPLPGVKSPFNPTLAAGEQPTLPASGGFEAMAQLPGGRYLLPITEKALTNETIPSRRIIHQVDTWKGKYTGRTWDYRTDLPNGLVADAQALDRHRVLVLERDDFEGAKAVIKRVYLVDLTKTNADGSLQKTLIVDLLNLANPGVTADTPGIFGLGSPFSFALQSVESLRVTGRDELTLASDNNFPFSNGRKAGTPDDTEMIRVQLPKGTLR